MILSANVIVVSEQMRVCVCGNVSFVLQIMSSYTPSIYPLYISRLLLFVLLLLHQICPEWSKDEIIDFISLILKFMGFVSFFVGFFMGFGFLGAIAWYKSLEQYQCEMV